MPDVAVFRERVQYNCDVSDALYARNYTMCVYLLKMREYFRWERGLALDAALPGEALGEWLAAREAYWDTLEDAPFRAPAGGQDVFDVPAINRLLGPGLHYAAGIGVFGKPHFLLGEVRARSLRDGVPVILVERELARDLTAPPAVSQDAVVIVRGESLRRAVWEAVQDWTWRRPPGAMARLMARTGDAGDPAAAVQRIAEQQIERVIAHELGEIRAGRQLGADWSQMLVDLSGTPAELLARAVRDHLADALVTLPGVLDDEDWMSLHFYFATLRGARQLLAPGLAHAYEQGVARDDLTPLRAALSPCHWLAAGQVLLARWRNGAGMPSVASLALDSPA